MNKNILKIRYTSTNLRVDEYFSWISDVLRWQGKFDINIILLDIPELLRWLQNSFAKFFKIIFDKHQMAESLIS